MSQINAFIEKQKMLTVNIAVSRETSKHLELDIKCHAKVQPSTDEDSKNILLNIELQIETQNENLKIVLESDIIFKVDKIPDDYNKVGEQVLIPLARKSLFEKLDDILVDMGYEKMGLARKMEG